MKQQRVFFDGEMRDVDFVFRVMKEGGFSEPDILQRIGIALGFGIFEQQERSVCS